MDMTEETQLEEQPVEAQATPEPEEQQSHEEQPKSADYNWQQARSVMEAQKAQIDALNAQMALMAAQKQPAPVDVPDELDQLNPDDVLTVAQARALATKQAKAAAKEIVEQHMAQHTLVNDEQRMRDKCDDYDYVLENFALPLIKNDPAMAHLVKTSKNPAETAYKLGKLSDQYTEQTTKQAVSPKAQKIMKNMSRPVNGNAVGSPLKSQADEFSKMSSQQVWEMSQKYARGA
jgi:hypothetical protein